MNAFIRPAAAILWSTLLIGGANAQMSPSVANEERIPNPVVEFEGLDKVTGRIVTFDVNVGETVQFGALQVTPRVCYTRPETEQPETIGFIEVDEITLQNETKRIFAGWMFADSPGLNAIEHPIYDVWLTDCKGGERRAAPPAPKVGG
ncbi:DUF2155 domain-containing protein [Terrihabitans sp. B22-R8]|uniref:DUF2155 domain-containing protein n=1 Tax=Terrihabitans sp. B22-R8 TaxID=3425128 RepID=UPI00403CABCB